MRPYSRVILLSVAGFVAYSCADPPPPGEPKVAAFHEPPGVPECAGARPDWPAAGLEVSARAETPECDLEFVEVVRLEGEGELLARPPVAVGPGGVFVSGLFERGRIAVWSADGALLRVFGEGDGEGPGEFGFPTWLAVGPDSVVHVMTGRALWHRYTLEGEFLGSVRDAGSTGVGRAMVREDGALLIAGVDPDSPSGRGLRAWKSGTVEALGALPGPPGAISLFGYSPRLGLWSAPSSRYELTHHPPPGGPAGITLRREVAWFSERDRLPANLFHLMPDERGFVWVMASAPAPDAPSGEPGPVTSPAEAVEQVVRYRNNVVEAIAIDGRLIASKRFGDPRLAPVAMTAELWYGRLDVAAETLAIFRPVLHPR